MSQTRENKEAMRRFVMDCQGAGDLDLIDEMIAPDFVNHAEVPGLPTGREGVKVLFGAFHHCFEGFHVVIHDQVAEDDKVATRKTFHGRHVNEFMGVPASGNDVAWDVIDIVRLEDGKLVEHWNVVDQLGLLRQIGALP
jgi:steroid delta-isomerase-like uncharacterized protein